MEESKPQVIAWLPEQSQSTELFGNVEKVNDVAIDPHDEVPALIASGGTAAQFGWEEFMHGKIRNTHTQAAYAHAVRKFLRHCERLGRALRQISPKDVGDYLDALDYANATKKLHLSAIRHLFDTLVTRHAVILNPAATVRAERLEVVDGKTPMISIQQCRQLLASIDMTSVVAVRDKAIIAILIYTAVRVGAVAKLRRSDFYEDGGEHFLRFAEKRGKSRELPVRHDLQKYVHSYVESACLEYSEKSLPLFRTAVRRTKQLTMNRMTANDMSRMVKRRLKDCGLSNRFSPHSFRVTAITDLLHQGVSLAEVQNLAGHKDPRTTRLYDRRKRQVTRSVVDRISI